MIVFLLAAAGCKKEGNTGSEETASATFPPPGWKADESGRYPATMTAVVALPPALAQGISTGDQLAAFIGDECRGVGSLVKVESKDLFFLLIRGLADEQSLVTFKYYHAAKKHLYRSGADLRFLVDAVWGTAANPKLLALTQVK